MAVKIRLRRMGAKKRPFYRLVVADARSPRDGRFIEAVGTYDPLATPAVVKINAERVKEWMSQGARPTDTARQLLVAEGLLERTTREYPQVEKKPKLNKKAIARAAAEAQAPPAAAPEPEVAAAEPEVAAAEPEAAAEAPSDAVPAAEPEVAAGDVEASVADTAAAEAPAVEAEVAAAEADVASAENAAAQTSTGETEVPAEEPAADEAADAAGAEADAGTVETGGGDDPPADAEKAIEGEK